MNNAIDFKSDLFLIIIMYGFFLSARNFEDLDL